MSWKFPVRDVEVLIQLVNSFYSFINSCTVLILIYAEKKKKWKSRVIFDEESFWHLWEQFESKSIFFLFILYQQQSLDNRNVKSVEKLIKFCFSHKSHLNRSVNLRSWLFYAIATLFFASGTIEDDSTKKGSFILQLNCNFMVLETKDFFSLTTVSFFLTIHFRCKKKRFIVEYKKRC